MLWQMISPVTFALVSVVFSFLPEKVRPVLKNASSAYCTVRAAWGLCGRSGWLCEAAFGKAAGAVILCAIAGGTLLLMILLEKDEKGTLLPLLYIVFCTPENALTLGVDTAVCASEVSLVSKTALVFMMTAAGCLYGLLGAVPELTRVMGYSVLLFRGLKGMEKNGDVRAFCIGAAAAAGCSFIG